MEDLEPKFPVRPLSYSSMTSTCFFCRKCATSETVCGEENDDTAFVIVSCGQKECLDKAQEYAPIVAESFANEVRLPTVREVLTEMGAKDRSRLP